MRAKVRMEVRSREIGIFVFPVRMTHNTQMFHTMPDFSQHAKKCKTCIFEWRQLTYPRELEEECCFWSYIKSIQFDKL